MYVWKPLSPSLPQQLSAGIAFGMTDIGNVRSSNEDNFLIDPALGLVAVADGMGGHEAGEVASADALLSLSHFIRECSSAATPANDAVCAGFDALLTDPNAKWSDQHIETMTMLHDGVEFANHRMYQVNKDKLHPDGGGMGTTLTGFWQALRGGPLFVFHVGDSRLYRLRDGRLRQLTRDQTMYQHALELGLRQNMPPRNLLLQALGPSPGIKPELQTRAVAAGDIYMLCSDGLHGASDDDDMRALLAAADPADLGATCAQLIDLAKQCGSRDNITVVLLYCP